MLLLASERSYAQYITAPPNPPAMPVGNIYSAGNSGGTQAADSGVAANTVTVQPLNVLAYGVKPDAHWGDTS
jgi:hypothetical protein